MNYVSGTQKEVEKLFISTSYASISEYSPGYMLFYSNKTVINMDVCKLKQIPKKRDSYGSGWVGPALTRKKIGKSSKNCPILVLKF